MALLDDDFRPMPGLWDGHVQTLVGSAWRPRLELPVRRERRTTPDGDFIDLDLLEGAPGAPKVLLLHGLEGSSSSGYVQVMLRDLAARGWSAIALNARGCSGEPNLLPASYSSADDRDLAWLVGQLEAPRLYVVGFSLGASVLLNFLAQHPLAERVSAAVAVSTPFDLFQAASFIDSGSFIARRYLAHFLPSLKARALAKAKVHPGHFDVPALAACRKLRDFDHLVTARHFGFASAEDYYAKCSTAPKLHAIRTRTLLLSAKDDALAAPALPADVTRNAQLDVLLTRRGGHVGFVVGAPWALRFWAEERVLRWLDER
jgi:predicted alpha/beta-fold hydrolase